jgi:phosphate transport system permease protein
MSLAAQAERAEAGRTARAGSRARRRARGIATGLRAYGEPMLWLTSGGLAFSLMMILGLLALVVVEGIDTFWPLPVVRIESSGAPVAVGEVTRTEAFDPTPEVIDTLPEEARAAAHAAVGRADGRAERRLVRTGNYEITGEHFRWVSNFAVTTESLPPWTMVVERRTWGRFYGDAVSYLVDGSPVADSPEKVVAELDARLPAIRERWNERRHLEVHEIGRVNSQVEEARLAVRGADRRHGRQSEEHAAAVAAAAGVEAATAGEFAAIRERIAALDAENARDELVLRTSDGKDVKVPVSGIVRAYAANQLGTAGKLEVYLSRWWEFLSDDPREANSEGGVFPAIFGTVAMTMLMSLMVTPFGVLAALFLREYARGGFVISAVRIAINNLAGVPSIVFGVFGLGFFCYIVGAGLDELLFSDKLPTPTFGTGGILWASLTLALLTLPVVIVATEEALAAVPNSMREGSYACGASKWQTIQRIVLPRAMPGILTGMILAIARGAGEVAPLMLVGAVKLAPELPIDGVAPFVHLQRSFMHLGFHIYDVGFQSQNSEAAKPMVYTTTLLLIMIVASLNLAAIWLRARLRRRFVTSQF